MSFSMNSKTKVQLSEEDISRIVQKYFDEELLESREINSGFYNTIYSLQFKTKTLILKVSPNPETEILTYEKDVMKRETKVYKLLNKVNIPVPEVLIEDYSKTLINSDFYIMTNIEGNTLFEKKSTVESDEIYFSLMKYLAIIHQVKMNTFGYDNFEYEIHNAQEAYLNMIDNLKRDATRKEMKLPHDVLSLLDMVYQYSDYLVDIDEPVLLHFDLWDGNIMIRNNKIVGLIDTERSLNFESMMEFAAMHWDIFAEDKKKFIDYYNKFSTRPIILNEESEIRYRLYQVYMYLLMLVECPFRDIDGSFNNQYNWAMDKLQELHRYFTLNISKQKL